MKTTILISILAVVWMTAHAQDPVKTSPQYYKVLLENDQVRVLEYRLKAGEKEPMHSHPAGVVYVLSGGKVRFTSPSGESAEVELPAGASMWRKAEEHATDNIGTTEVHALFFEPK